MTSPYTPPATSLTKETPIGGGTDAYGNPLPQLLENPRSCSAGTGLNWWIKAFEIFKDNALLWIGICVVAFIIFIVLGFIPGLNILSSFIGMFVVAGLVKGVSDQMQGKQLKLEYLWLGFQTHLMPLCILTLLLILGTILLFIPVGIIGAIFMMVIYGGLNSVDAMMYSALNGSIFGMVFLMIIVMFICFMPLIMAMWFAPTLIILEDMSAIDAIKTSFKACLKNIVPFIIYVLVAMVAVPIILIFTLGLGALVLYPMSIIIYYVSYRDILTDQPLTVS